MSSISETGHAKNVANYEKLIADVTALGVTFNPSKANLKLTALNTQLTAAKACWCLQVATHIISVETHGFSVATDTLQAAI